MDWAAAPLLLLPLITALPMLLLCKAGKLKDGSGGEDILSSVSTLSTNKTASHLGTDSGTSTSKRAVPNSSDSKHEVRPDVKKSPLKSPLGFHKEIVVPIGKASVETPVKSNMSKRENRKMDSSKTSKTSSKRLVRFK